MTTTTQIIYDPRQKNMARKRGETDITWPRAALPSTARSFFVHYFLLYPSFLYLIIRAACCCCLCVIVGTEAVKKAVAAAAALSPPWSRRTFLFFLSNQVEGEGKRTKRRKNKKRTAAWPQTARKFLTPRVSSLKIYSRSPSRHQNRKKLFT